MKLNLLNRSVSSGLLILSAAATLVLPSCASNDELEDRLERRNENYSDLQERREMRLDARQDRTDAWFDRAMH